jgi:hypothetical protein
VAAAAACRRVCCAWTAGTGDTPAGVWLHGAEHLHAFYAAFDPHLSPLAGRSSHGTVLLTPDVGEQIQHSLLVTARELQLHLISEELQTREKLHVASELAVRTSDGNAAWCLLAGPTGS